MSCICDTGGKWVKGDHIALGKGYDWGKLEAMNLSIKLITKVDGWGMLRSSKHKRLPEKVALFQMANISVRNDGLLWCLVLFMKE